MPRNYTPKYTRGKYNKEEGSSSSENKPIRISKQDLEQTKALREAVFFFKNQIKKNFVSSSPRTKTINVLQDLIDCFDKHITRSHETALVKTTFEIQEYFGNQFPSMSNEEIESYAQDLTQILENNEILPQDRTA